MGSLYRQLLQSFAESRIKSMQKYKQAKMLNQQPGPQYARYRSSRQKRKELFLEKTWGINKKYSLNRHKTFLLVVSKKVFITILSYQTSLHLKHKKESVLQKFSKKNFFNKPVCRQAILFECISKCRGLVGTPTRTSHSGRCLHRPLSTRGCDILKCTHLFCLIDLQKKGKHLCMVTTFQTCICTHNKDGQVSNDKCGSFTTTKRIDQNSIFEP